MQGIGGRLRREPEDFVVKELSMYPPMKEGGGFTAAVVRSRNWETNRLIRRMARKLRISRNRIHFAGTKDKRAVTTQLFVILAPLKYVEDLRMPDVDVLEAYQTDKSIKMGELIGNEFEIAVREIAIESREVEERTSSVDEVISTIGGFPNFFGVQRFGAVRPITHIVGKCIVRGDFGKAVNTYVANPIEGEGKEEFEARKALDESGDYSEALRSYPKTLSFEKAILNHLVQHEEDYVGSLYELPMNLLMMFVHSYQSYLFNIVLSRRIEKGLPLNEPLSGDIVLPVDRQGLPDHNKWMSVDEGNIEKLKQRCSEKKAFVSGVLFGSEVQLAGGEMGEIERGVIERERLDRNDFIVPKMIKLSSKGTRRELLAPVKELNYEVFDDHLFLKFQLTKGCYATSLLREYMKSENMMDY
jgi:tRNA pseudouridine13 synthase